MSTGIPSFDDPLEADDLFRSLRSLATGNGLVIRTCGDDVPLAGTDAASELTRAEWTAETAPLLLWGGCRRGR